MSNIYCKNCYAYNDQGNECRLNPPVFVRETYQWSIDSGEGHADAVAGAWTFPTTWPDDWCGQFVEAETSENEP